MELADSLKAIANAIRSKTGKTEEMTIEQMEEEIYSISSSGSSLKALLDGRKNSDFLFKNYSGTEIPDGLIEYNYTSNVTSTSNMFYSCKSLTTIPLLDTRNVTNMSGTFSGCTSLTTIPLLDTRNVTNMSSTFTGCTSLTTIPLLDTRNVTSMSSMFYNCKSLTTIPLLDTSSVNDAYNMFYSCKSLTTIPLLDTRNVTNMSGTFTGCTSLTECWIRNIRAPLTVSSGTSYGHLLTVESLLHLIKELRNVGMSRTLTIGSANLEKLATTYVKLVDITDGMRAEDEFIDQKLPFEVCESTDEGALSIINDYPTLKQWSIK